MAESRRPVPRADRVFHAAVAAGLAGMFAVSLWPTDLSRFPATFGVGADAHSVCMLRRVTGMPCPTCGVSRSFRALGQGEPMAAVRFHPLGPLYYAMLAVVMVRSGGMAVRGRRWLEGVARVMVWSLPFVVAATLAVYGVRMVWFFASGTGSAAWEASPMGRILSGLG